VKWVGVGVGEGGGGGEWAEVVCLVSGVCVSTCGACRWWLWLW